ncbi:MAG: hypothetical protein AB1649_31875 [Chloroflexota bacterium]
MHIPPFLSINHSCGETLQWTKKQLLQAGLRTVQTFDLHAARAGLYDCPCPNHGTNECDCQMVVLLVYDKAEDVSTLLNTGPVSLILHGNGGQTWLTIADAPNQNTNATTVTAIINSLEGNLPATKPNLAHVNRL